MFFVFFVSSETDLKKGDLRNIYILGIFQDDGWSGALGVDLDQVAASITSQKGRLLNYKDIYVT